MTLQTMSLNLRDLGGLPFPGGTIPARRYLRSGKLSVLSKEACETLCRKYNIGCVIDLRTRIEAAEFPDPLPEGVAYVHIPLLKDAAVGLTHETGSDPLSIVRMLKKEPERLYEMLPDFPSLYANIVTDAYSRSQLDRAVATLKENAARGICTLYHCTAGKDRTGITTMALLKSYGVSDEDIVRDFMRTNRYAFLPTIKKCMAVWFITWDWTLVKTAYRCFMADRKLIEIAIRLYAQR